MICFSFFEHLIPKPTGLSTCERSVSFHYTNRQVSMGIDNQTTSFVSSFAKLFQKFHGCGRDPDYFFVPSFSQRTVIDEETSEFLYSKLSSLYTILFSII